MPAPTIDADDLEIAEMLLRGLVPSQIAPRVGLTREQVFRIRAGQSRPGVAAYVDYVRNEAANAHIDRLAAIKTLALEVIEKRLRADDVPILQYDAAVEILKHFAPDNIEIAKRHRRAAHEVDREAVRESKTDARIDADVDTLIGRN